MKPKKPTQQVDAVKSGSNNQITPAGIKGTVAHWIGASVLVLSCGGVYIVAVLADKSPEGLLAVLKVWVGGHGF